MTKRKLRKQILELQDEVWALRLVERELRGHVAAGERELSGFRRGLAWNQPPADTAARIAARNGTAIA